MGGLLFSFVDRWIGRRAVPNPEALAAIRDLAPAVVVTGASRGIGRAIAARFARAGHTVVLIARDPNALTQAAADIACDQKLKRPDVKISGVATLPLALDITDADAPHRIDATLRAHGLYADVVVNNAGIGLAGAFETHSTDDIDRLIALNITAATRLMHHVLPAMLARGRGGVLNVGSIGGLVPGPHQAAYYASKAYLISLTEAVAHEIRGRGVRLAVVVPGPVDTGFHLAMRAQGALYRLLIPSLSPPRVAESGYVGFMLGRRVIVPGIIPTSGALALKVLPHALTVPLIGHLLEVKEQKSQQT